jgi:hypothetical protein
MRTRACYQAKQSRAVGVFLLTRDLKDTLLGGQALRADAEGYLGPNESEKFLHSLLK